MTDSVNCVAFFDPVSFDISDSLQSSSDITPLSRVRAVADRKNGERRNDRSLTPHAVFFVFFFGGGVAFFLGAAWGCGGFAAAALRGGRGVSAAAPAAPAPSG